MSKKSDDAARPVGQYLMEASDNYPENQLETYFDFKTGKELHPEYGGDTLALFIGREIASVHDETATDSENRCNIVNALNNAVNEMRRVINHFDGIHYGECLNAPR